MRDGIAERLGAGVVEAWGNSDRVREKASDAYDEQDLEIWLGGRDSRRLATHEARPGVPESGWDADSARTISRRPCLPSATSGNQDR